MSENLSIVSILLNTGNEKSILWLDTFYFNCKPYSISNMKHGRMCKYEADYALHGNVFIFYFERISELEFRITCKRKPLIEHFGNYAFQFFVFINVFDEDPKVLEMNYSKFSVHKSLSLDASYRTRILQSDFTRDFELKIVVKMIEYDCAPAQTRFNQEKEFRKMKEAYFNDESTLNDLCYILDRPKIADIFTGRQSNQFAHLKTLYITRTATLSKEIASYMRHKVDYDSLPLINLGFILNYIYSGEQVLISDADLFSLYIKAHHLGLNFLIDLSRDCILKRLGIHNFMIEALKVADRVNDRVLFEKVAKESYSWAKDFMNCNDLFEKEKKSDIQIRFMVHSLNRYYKEIELQSKIDVLESIESKIIKLLDFYKLPL